MNRVLYTIYAYKVIDGYVSIEMMLRYVLLYCERVNPHKRSVLETIRNGKLDEEAENANNPRMVAFWSHEYSSSPN